MALIETVERDLPQRHQSVVDNYAKEINAALKNVVLIPDMFRAYRCTVSKDGDTILFNVKGDYTSLYVYLKLRNGDVFTVVESDAFVKSGLYHEETRLYVNKVNGSGILKLADGREFKFKMKLTDDEPNLLDELKISNCSEKYLDQETNTIYLTLNTSLGKSYVQVYNPSLTGEELVVEGEDTKNVQANTLGYVLRSGAQGTNITLTYKDVTYTVVYN